MTVRLSKCYRYSCEIILTDEVQQLQCKLWSNLADEEVCEGNFVKLTNVVVNLFQGKVSV